VSRFARRRDENEPSVVKALLAAGMHVAKLEGSGVPDLVVQHKGRCFLVEVKQPVDVKKRSAAHKGTLTDSQRKWWEAWGPIKPIVVTTPEEAVRLVREAAGEASKWIDSAGNQQELEVV